MTVDSSVAVPGSAEVLLEALDPEQRAVATALLGPVCVLAGAGTGKTRAITHRIAYGVRTGTYTPSAVLAVTFTTRAAGEMRERLRSLGAPGIQARTFHSAALRQLSHFLPKLTGHATPRLMEHKAAAVAQAAGRIGLEIDKTAVRDYASEIEWAKVQCWTAQDYQYGAAEAGREPVAGYDAIAIARLMRAYEEVLAETQAMDFEDVLLATAGLLQEFPQMADEVRRRYRHFVVDEYQDVSPLQQRLLNLWLGQRTELCVVGDPSQTIYSFTGATSRYLLDFGKVYPAAEVVKLVRDYRSTPQVVNLANTVLKMRSSNRLEAASPVALELLAQRSPGPEVTYLTARDDADEATRVANRIEELVSSGLDPSEIAVLFRTNSQSEPFEHALGEAGIPYQVRGGARFFTRPEVRAGIARLRTEARTAADLPVIERVHAALEVAGWTSQPPPGRGATRERWESLDALERLVRQTIESGAATLTQVVAVIEDRQANEHAPTAAGVTLASLHAAKGLEWEAVFLAGLADGLLPISLAQGPEQIAEERRLVYVGITRARTHLTLSYATARQIGGAAIRKPCRFLASWWPDSQAAAKSTSRSTVPGVEDLGPDQRALFNELRTWRAEVARTASRPAFTILTDFSLRALAQRQPATIRELAAVPGIGPIKIEQYGPSLLSVILRH